MNPLSNSPPVVAVQQHMLTNLSVVDNARRVGDVVVSVLRTSPRVVVAFHGVRGVSSSFFNAILLTLKDALGSDGVMRAVEFQTDSQAQQQVLSVSMSAVLGPSPTSP